MTSKVPRSIRESDYSAIHQQRMKFAFAIAKFTSKNRAQHPISNGGRMISSVIFLV